MTKRGSGNKTISRVGPKRAKVVNARMSTVLSAPYAAAASAAEGPSFSGTGTFYGSVSFDPTGTFTAWGGPQTAGVAVLGGNTSALQQPINWLEMAQIYEEYVVTRVTLRFTAYDTADLTSGNPYLYVRFNDTYNTVTAPFVAPNIQSFSTEPGWIRKQFTASDPSFTFSFKPKVMKLSDNNGIFTADCRYPGKMRFQAHTLPAELWGMKYYLVKPSSDASVISCNVIYHIKFRKERL